MASKVYECMFIFNANAFARNPGSASHGISEMVENLNGEVLASRMWNEQKLCFPIKGQRKGVYWLSYIKLDGESLPKFNRACQLNDIILRHLVISIDPRLVNTLVAAANNEKPVAENPAEQVTETDDSDNSSESETASEQTESVAG